jgi:parallel beta-helix repeat protein
MKSKKKSIFFCIVLICAIFAVAMPVNVSAEPRTIYVDDDNTSGPWDGTLAHPYQTIQDGVDAAVAGDTVFVFTGTYYENVVIDEAITLHGENRETTIIQGNGIGDGISSSYVDGITIENLNIKGFETGIDLRYSCENTISGNIISNNKHHGIYLAYFCDGSKISENTVSNCYWGIFLYLADDNTILSNEVLDQHVYAIHLLNSDGNTIEDNTVMYNDVYGIWLWQNSNNNIIIGNTLVYNDRSIVLGDSDSNTISGNTIRLNKKGIWIINSNLNDIYHNNIIENIIQMYDDSSNTWDDGEGKGNYWSDYIGFDDGSPDPRTGEPRPDGDGVGDTEIPHLEVDWYPLMMPWGLDDETEKIVKDIKELGLPRGVEDSLVSILEAAIIALENGNEIAATQQLEAFILLVEALRGRKLTDEQADALIAAAQEIIDMLS